MTHLRTQYGIFRATDFANLYIDLEAKMGNSSDFTDFSSRFRLIFAQFETNNQPISQLQQFTFLSRAIAPFSHLVKAQDTILIPAPARLELWWHIFRFTPPISLPTSSDTEYAAPAIATSPIDPIQSFLFSSQFASIVATAAAATKLPNNNRPENTTTNSRNNRPAKGSRKYCHLHGYDWHDSGDCRNMAKDKAKKTYCCGMLRDMCLV